MKIPRREKGSMESVPIHQEADPLNPSAVSVTAIATGLKICFLLIARIYFDAMVRTPAKRTSGKSANDFIGDIIKAKIRAEIYTDSTLAGALNAFAKILFVIQQITTRACVVAITEIGLYVITPKNPKIEATARRSIK
jgi:hypothetical protein